ncbi:MAG TPA: PIG-L family deacetylase, partial [Gemmatimonadales bacterium]|nr:PIG-L family deacetylase [Gemmatimonadales bacterium]
MPDEFKWRDDGYVPARAMVIMAHPDDIEFSCAGTVARWLDTGCAVCYVLVTSGDGGIEETGMTRARAAAIREAEQRAAAAAIGVAEVVFLGEPDGMVENTMSLRRRLVREIRRFRPEVVVTFDPAALWVAEDYINHPDHRAVGMAAVDAVFPAAGQPNVFEELADEGLTA